MQNRRHDNTKMVAYLLWVAFGGMGVHRFYLGDKVTGLAQVTLALAAVLIMDVSAVMSWVGFGFLGLWLVYDLFRIPALVRAKQQSSGPDGD